MKRTIATALAATALLSAQGAQAQSTCIASEDLDDAIIYAMPLVYQAAKTACVNEFARDGFMATGGASFVDGFRQRQDAAWPGAFRLLKVFMQQGKGGAGSEEIEMLISTLPPDTLRPFVDGIVTQKLVGEIKPDTCGKIERGMELISPLPVDNVSGLVTFIAQQVDLKNPEICKPRSDAAAE